MNELITIAIPTYNRASELKGLLREILEQLSDVRQGIFSVRISDNASTDSTPEIVEDFKRRFRDRRARLDYSRNDENIGFSKNVHRVVTDSRGEWVLVMGDDDSLEAGTLSYLERIVSEHPDIDAMLLGHSRYSADLSVLLDRPHDAAERLEFFKDGADYIRRFRAFPPALVSGYLIRRSLWILSSAQDFDYSISIHMLALTRMMVRHASVAVSGRRSVKYRADQSNSTWPKDELYPFRFWLDALQASKLVKDESDNDVFKILSTASYRVLAYYIIRQKVQNHRFNRRLFADYYHRAKCGCNRYAVIIAILTVTPNWIVRILFRGLVDRVEK